MNSPQDDTESTKGASHAARDAASFFEARQRHHAQMAQDFGYAKDLFLQIADNFDSLTGDPKDPLMVSAENSIRRFREFADAKESVADRHGFDVVNMSYAIAGTNTSTVMVLAELGVEPIPESIKLPKPPPHRSEDHRTQLAASLEKIDTELGRLCRSIWQSFYSGIENEERAGLALMRQLYDHFFSVLAPDDKVRCSEFFTEKTENDPKKVHRRERLHYAAHHHVRDEQLRQNLTDQIDHVISIYGRLNELHARKPLSRKPIEALLIAMEEVVSEWVYAIEAR